MQQGSGILIAGFEGTQPTPSILQKVAQGTIGGIIFFSRNIADLNEFVEVGERLQAYRPAGAPPLILSIDQEGGRVQRIRSPLTVWPPMAVLGAIDDVDLTERVGFALGSELRALGLNLDYAPVLDVHTNPKNPIIGDRAFAANAAGVVKHAISFWRGLEAAGIRGCGKHFPGHGDSATDSHLELPVVAKTAEQLWRDELAPFQAGASSGVAMLMTAHVVYPAIDNKPATLSSVWLSKILREQLGFQGVIVSDDLEMKAVSELQNPELSVEQALLAGVDGFLICRDEELQDRAETTLQNCARTSSVFSDRLAQAQHRVSKFRSTLAQGATGIPSAELLAEHARLRETLQHRFAGSMAAS